MMKDDRSGELQFIASLSAVVFINVQPDRELNNSSRVTRGEAFNLRALTGKPRSKN